MIKNTWLSSKTHIWSIVDSTGKLLHVNRVNSSFGSGWGLGGLQELVENDDGSVLLIDGDGSEQLFEKAKGKRQEATGMELDEEFTTYVSPPGDFSVLTRNSDGTFQRTMKDQMVYGFNIQNQLEFITDANSNQAQYIYNSNQQLKEIVDPVGLKTTLSYNNQGKVSSIVDPAGRVTQLEYDEAGNLIRITDPDNSQRSWSYDSKHHLTAQIDQRSHSSLIFSSGSGQRG